MAFFDTIVILSIFLLPGIVVPLLIYFLISRIFKISRVKNAIVTLIVTIILFLILGWILIEYFIFPWTDCLNENIPGYISPLVCKTIQLWEIEVILLALVIITIPPIIQKIRKKKMIKS